MWQKGRSFIRCWKISLKTLYEVLTQRTSVYKDTKWGSSGATLCKRPLNNLPVCPSHSPVRSLLQLLLFSFIFSSFWTIHWIILEGSIKFCRLSDLTRPNNETPGVTNWMTRRFDKPAHPKQTACTTFSCRLFIYFYVKWLTHHFNTWVAKCLR